MQYFIIFSVQSKLRLGPLHMCDIFETKLMTALALILGVLFWYGRVNSLYLRSLSVLNLLCSLGIVCDLLEGQTMLIICHIKTNVVTLSTIFWHCINNLSTYPVKPLANEGAVAQTVTEFVIFGQIIHSELRSEYGHQQRYKKLQGNFSRIGGYRVAHITSQ